MGRGAGNEDEKGESRLGGRYDPEHGSADQAHRAELGDASSSDGAPGAPQGGSGPPWFPDLDSLKAANRLIHDKAGQSERFALDQPSPLESALAKAYAAFVPTDIGRIRTAALLAHGIAQAQGFRDGNRRTAYWVTHAFLSFNGLGYLIKKDDHMMTRYLNQLVENQSRAKPGPTPQTFESLFLRRLGGAS